MFLKKNVEKIVKLDAVAVVWGQSTRNNIFYLMLQIFLSRMMIPNIHFNLNRNLNVLTSLFEHYTQEEEVVTAKEDCISERDLSL